MENLNFIGPVCSTSYGNCCINIVDELVKMRVRVSLFPINPQTAQCSPRYQETIQFALRSAAMFDFDAPCVRLWHAHDMSLFAGRGEHIGFPIFELDKFKSVELHHIYGTDRTFVCSDWAKTVVKHELYDHFKTVDAKINIVPLGVDRNIFFPEPFKRPETIFMSCGKWEKRKGHDILGDVFCQAFSEKDNVQLWLAADNVHYTEEENRKWREKYQRLYRRNQIRFINWCDSQERLAKIYNQADVLISLSRAEGWNLPLLEGMACGKHIIATNYSGHTQYCTRQNSHLIDIDGLEVASDVCDVMPSGKWFKSLHGNWASIGQKQIDQCIDYMRDLHDRKQSGRLAENEAGIATSKEFSWTNSAEKIANILL